MLKNLGVNSHDPCNFQMVQQKIKGVHLLFIYINQIKQNTKKNRGYIAIHFPILSTFWFEFFLTVEKLFYRKTSGLDGSTRVLPHIQRT